MLHLNRLQSFVAVVEAESFTGAAATLGVTKALVSLHVKQLEAEIGCALLVRTTRGVVPTDAGQRFHQASVRLLREAESAVAEARGAHEILEGPLRVTSTAEYLTQVLVPAVAEFSARHPRLEIELSASPRPSNLVRERFDLAVRLGRLTDSSLQATTLGRFLLIAVATPELVARHGLPGDPEDLTRLPWVLHSGLEWPLVWSARQRAGSHSVTLKSAIRSDSAAAIHRLALAHVGAVILPDWMLRDDLAAGRLVRLVPDHDLPVNGIFAVRPQAGHVPARVRRFVEFLRVFVNKYAGTS